jgi:hypothetical protein
MSRISALNSVPYCNDRLYTRVEAYYEPAQKQATRKFKCANDPLWSEGRCVKQREAKKSAHFSLGLSQMYFFAAHGMRRYQETVMSNIVICCDGTGNQVESNLSNVLKLFCILHKNEGQRVYYNPGIGTIGSDNPWTKLVQNTKGVFELATGYGLDAEILGAYRFLAQTYQKGDRVFLFGFSRGAYTVRALAGFIHMIGLLPSDQLNIANYALSAYKKVSGNRDFQSAWHFAHVTGARTIIIDFIGVWDTSLPFSCRAGTAAFPFPLCRRCPIRGPTPA